MEVDRIEESSERFVGSSSSLGSSSGNRWVDGSEVYWESPPWASQSDERAVEGFGSIRRRLVKKPKRVDSFDVEAMEVAGSYGQYSKVIFCSSFV